MHALQMFVKGANSPSALLPLSHSSNFQQPPRNPKSIISCTAQSHKNSLNFIPESKLLSEISTWGIGGPCKCFLQVSDHAQLISAIRYCNEQTLRYIIVGKGSNCLFDDMGLEGCVILNRIELFEKIEAGVYRVGSGYPFNGLGVLSANEGFTGLEFAAGVPGTVGGAVYMNAGANGQETADSIENIEILTTGGQIQVLNRSDLRFGYRKSPFQDMKNLAAITNVIFRLTYSDQARKRQQEYMRRRKETQPLGERSAGSVFRNPSCLDVTAAELIDRAGLKGLRVGGATVSNKHANFFINCGGATSRHMLELIGMVKDTVVQKFGVQLKEEILYIDPYLNRRNLLGDV